VRLKSCLLLDVFYLLFDAMAYLERLASAHPFEKFCQNFNLKVKKHNFICSRHVHCNYDVWIFQADARVVPFLFETQSSVDQFSNIFSWPPIFRWLLLICSFQFTSAFQLYSLLTSVLGSSLLATQWTDICTWLTQTGKNASLWWLQTTLCLVAFARWQH